MSSSNIVDSVRDLQREVRALKAVGDTAKVDRIAGSVDDIKGSIAGMESSLGITVHKSTGDAPSDNPGGAKGDLWLKYDDLDVVDPALLAAWWWDGNTWVGLPVVQYLDTLHARGIEANEAVIAMLASQIITSGEFKTSNGNFIVDDNGLRLYNPSDHTLVANIPSDGSGSSFTGKFIAGDPNGSHVSMDNTVDGTNLHDELIGEIGVYDKDNAKISGVQGVEDRSGSNIDGQGIELFIKDQDGHFSPFISYLNPSNHYVFTDIYGRSYSYNDPNVMNLTMINLSGSYAEIYKSVSNTTTASITLGLEADDEVSVNGVRFDRRVYTADQFIDWNSGYLDRNGSTIVKTAGMLFLNFGYSGYTPNSNTYIGKLKDGFLPSNQMSGVANVWGQAGGYVINPDGEIYVSSGGADQYAGSFQVFWAL